MLEQFPSGGRALQQRPDVRVVPTPRFPFLIFYIPHLLYDGGG
jgi:hypothetical protein